MPARKWEARADWGAWQSCGTDAFIHGRGGRKGGRVQKDAHDWTDNGRKLRIGCVIRVL